MRFCGELLYRARSVYWIPSNELLGDLPEQKPLYLSFGDDFLEQQFQR